MTFVPLQRRMLKPQEQPNRNIGNAYPRTAKSNRKASEATITDNYSKSYNLAESNLSNDRVTWWRTQFKSQRSYSHRKVIPERGETNSAVSFITILWQSLVSMCGSSVCIFDAMSSQST
mmetsp:Transcript_45102/g.109128  ORF Transcript_45102/g.109128 Transcript_45102/m.109128 type:complete len:119 (+) Transcript_45102:987-1343(+)